MNLLNIAKSYKAKFVKTATKPLEGIETVESAIVVNGKHDKLSICFIEITGTRRFLTLDADSVLDEGDVVDPATVMVHVLERDGETIYRVDGQLLAE